MSEGCILAFKTFTIELNILLSTPVHNLVFYTNLSPNKKTQSLKINYTVMIL